jgi:hypothetical protein
MAFLVGEGMAVGAAVAAGAEMTMVGGIAATALAVIMAMGSKFGKIPIYTKVILRALASHHEVKVVGKIMVNVQA